MTQVRRVGGFDVGGNAWRNILNRTGKCGYRLRVIALLVGLSALSAAAAPPVASALEPVTGCLNGWQFFSDGNAYACRGAGGVSDETPIPAGERYWDPVNEVWHYHDLTGGSLAAEPIPGKWRLEEATREGDGKAFTVKFTMPSRAFSINQLRALNDWFKSLYNPGGGFRDPFIGCSFSSREIPDVNGDIGSDCQFHPLSTPTPPSCENFSWTTAPGLLELPLGDHCFDPSGLVLTHQVITPPQHGAFQLKDGTLSYIPAAGFYGEDSLTYGASNGQSARSSTPMVLKLRVNAPPVCSQQGDVWASRGIEKQFTFSCDDPYLSEGFKAEVEQRPDHGRLVVDGARLRYTAEADYLGPDSFTVRGVDGWGLKATNSSTYSVDVREAPPVCKPRQAFGFGAESESQVKFTVACEMPGGFPQLAPFSYWVGDGEHGTTTVDPLTGEVLYTPDQPSITADQVPYGALNGEIDSNSSTVTVRMVHSDR